MSLEPHSDPRQQLEARVVAWLLGEASPFEAAELEMLIQADAELAGFHRRMKQVIARIQETTAAASANPGPAADAPRFPPERRAALLERLRQKPAPVPPEALVSPPATRSSIPSPAPAAYRASPGSRRWPRWRIPAAAAASLMALLAIGYVWRLAQSRPLLMAKHEPPAVIDRLDAAGESEALSREPAPAAPATPPPALGDVPVMGRAFRPSEPAAAPESAALSRRAGAERIEERSERYSYRAADNESAAVRPAAKPTPLALPSIQPPPAAQPTAPPATRFAAGRPAAPAPSIESGIGKGAPADAALTAPQPQSEWGRAAAPRRIVLPSMDAPASVEMAGQKIAAPDQQVAATWDESRKLGITDDFSISGVEEALKSVPVAAGKYELLPQAGELPIRLQVMNRPSAATGLASDAAKTDTLLFDAGISGSKRVAGQEVAIAGLGSGTAGPIDDNGRIIQIRGGSLGFGGGGGAGGGGYGGFAAGQRGDRSDSARVGGLAGGADSEKPALEVANGLAVAAKQNLDARDGLRRGEMAIAGDRVEAAPAVEGRLGAVAVTRGLQEVDGDLFGFEFKKPASQPAEGEAQGSVEYDARLSTASELAQAHEKTKVAESGSSIGVVTNASLAFATPLAAGYGAIAPAAAAEGVAQNWYFDVGGRVAADDKSLEQKVRGREDASRPLERDRLSSIAPSPESQSGSARRYGLALAGIPPAPARTPAPSMPALAVAGPAPVTATPAAAASGLASQDNYRTDPADVVRQKELAQAVSKDLDLNIPGQTAASTATRVGAQVVKKEEDKAAAAPQPPAPPPLPEIETREQPFSTFSMNVSDVSFKLAAASLEKGVLPDPGTIRSEEFVNAFDYRDPAPKAGARLAFAWERAQYPFAHNRDVVRMAIQTAARGREPGRALNLVVLLDSSGSMERADRIRIVQEALRLLARQLQPADRISVVAFSRAAHLWVDGMAGGDPDALLVRVLDLKPEGGTNIEAALDLAYQTALRHFLATGNNRVILLTDGAANLGNVDPAALQETVEAHRKRGIALDCFGVGWEGYSDYVLETLSRHGDGRYGFINRPEDAAAGFASQLAGALHVAAADVKAQIEFNPNRVLSYRQVGYAKHQLTKEQFRDNTVDAAEIGAAESGNALYVVQVNPRGQGPLGVARVRFKVPATGEYVEQEWTLAYQPRVAPFERSSPAMRLAAVAAAFAEWLAGSPFAIEVRADRLERYLEGVPSILAPDPRPERLAWMIRQARSLRSE